VRSGFAYHEAAQIFSRCGHLVTASWLESDEAQLHARTRRRSRFSADIARHSEPNNGLVCHWIAVSFEQRRVL